jgi:DNA-binding NarL/FixJ family response regulator
MSNVEIVKVLLQYIGNDLEQDKAIAQGAVILLDAEKAPEADAAPKQREPEKKPEKQSKPKKTAPKKEKFDTGKMIALLNGGWSVAKIADEMGCSTATIYNHMKEEGLYS